MFQVVPKKRFNDVVTKNGVGLAFAVMGMTSFLDGPAAGSGLGAVGEARLTPDLSTKRPIPWYASFFLYGLEISYYYSNFFYKNDVRIHHYKKIKDNQLIPFLV